MMQESLDPKNSLDPDRECGMIATELIWKMMTIYSDIRKFKYTASFPYT